MLFCNKQSVVAIRLCLLCVWRRLPIKCHTQGVLEWMRTFVEVKSTFLGSFIELNFFSVKQKMQRLDFLTVAVIKNFELLGQSQPRFCRYKSLTHRDKERDKQLLRWSTEWDNTGRNASFKFISSTTNKFALCLYFHHRLCGSGYCTLDTFVIWQKQVLKNYV